jgi:hypothetical protein
MRKTEATTRPTANEALDSSSSSPPLVPPMPPIASRSPTVASVFVVGTFVPVTLTFVDGNVSELVTDVVDELGDALSADVDGRVEALVGSEAGVVVAVAGVAADDKVVWLTEVAVAEVEVFSLVTNVVDMCVSVHVVPSPPHTPHSSTSAVPKTTSKQSRQSAPLGSSPQTPQGLYSAVPNTTPMQSVHDAPPPAHTPHSSY